MHEELHITELLLKKFDKASDDIANINVGMGKLMVLAESTQKTLDEMKTAHIDLERRFNSHENKFSALNAKIGVIFGVACASILSLIKSIFHS